MLTQGSPEWLEMRRSYIGASDAPIIMLQSPWTTPYQLWQQKLGLTEGPKMTAAMQRGKDLEEPARQQFEAMTGLIMNPNVVFHKEHPFMMASLDGMTFDGKHIVEIKCVNRKDHETAVMGGVPVKYQAQVQHQLACCPSADFAYYFSYDAQNPDKSAIVEVPRDDKFIEKMIQEHTKFWECVRTKTPPPLTEKDFEDIETLEENVDVWQDLCSKYLEVSDKANNYLTIQKELRSKMIEMSNGRNLQGFGIKVCHHLRKGAVDYKKIPALQGENLDQYRSDPTLCSKITLSGN